MTVPSEGEIEYECLAPIYPLRVHLAAGALAGLAEHVIMYPVDSVKTRLQSLCPCPDVKCAATPLHGLAAVMRREGWRRPLRGVNAVALGSVPAHALYFSIYEKLKSLFTGNTYGYSNAFNYGLAGVGATMAHDLIMNPAEVVKQRMQMAFSPYGGSLECARCIYRIEGVSAFYRSYTTQLIMNIPFQATHFVTYEFIQEVLNPRHQFDPTSHLLAGGCAGGLAAALTTPLDCIKTVLNTQQTPEFDANNRLLLKATKSYRGIVDAVTSIHQSRGLAGFTRGMQARVIYQTPATALSWSVYELFKYVLA